MFITEFIYIFEKYLAFVSCKERITIVKTNVGTHRENKGKHA